MWTNLWSKRNLIQIPNPDIFQYINDGKDYLNFKLPTNIHPAPLAPILITGIARLLPDKITYPEIQSAHLINITSTTLSIIFIYALTASFIGPLKAFGLTLLLSTNQIITYHSLNVTNEVMYFFGLSFCLWLYNRSKHPLVYLLIGLLFLLRYESAVLPVAIFIVEYFTSPKKLKIKNVFFAFLPIIFWALVLHFHSSGSSLADNAYLVEIKNGWVNVPNTLVFTKLLEIITMESSHTTLYCYLFMIVLFGLIYHKTSAKDTKPIEIIIYITLLFSLLFLYIFPNFTIRYYVPFIWMTYLILINLKSSFIAYSIIFSLGLYNFVRVNLPSNYIKYNEGSDYRLMTDWLNSQNFDKPVTVLVYEPYIPGYFIKNPKVSSPYIISEMFTKCQNKIICVAATLKEGDPEKDIFIVANSTAQTDIHSPFDAFTANLHHASSFNYDILKNHKDLKFVRVEGDLNHWYHLFQYIGK